MRYTANYSHSNHNFVIQNLEGERVESKYLPAICILKNILQRGKPTLLSTFLQGKIGSIHENRDVFEKPYPLIDTKLPKWDKTIKGDEKQDYNPAKEFYKDLPRYLSECELPDYEFIQQLLLPEASINVIIPPKDGEEEQKFLRQQVDFYLPQARLIIEIDGIDPDTKRPHGNRQENDSGRDRHAKDRGIETVRITTVDLKSKNKTFWKKIEAIRNRIIREQENRRAKNKTFISLNDYKKAFKDGVDLQDHNYLATAIMRFQILLLELLERGLINFNEPWAFEIIERDVKGFAELAIEDLLEWFQHLLNLQKVEFRKPEYKINDKIHSTKATIKIDFSLLQRHDESAQDNESIIFVRNDYLDEFYDHFQVSTYKQKIKYKLKIGEESSDEASLWFLLLNIFLQNNENLNLDTRNFREGQLAIIVNALSCNDTIGLLPTGAGKSVCYQLSAILQPAISFVVCPLKSLMYDQKDELDSVYFTRTNYITSDDDGKTRERKQKEFEEGKYLFILITPERFQIKSFRDYLRRVNDRFSIAYAVIDEVHCFSEWGHDFRLSYLNLANTIKNHCSNFTFLGLTATASEAVRKDIKVEFKITEDNIKSRLDCSREELDFTVIDDENKKKKTLIEKLDHLKETTGILKLNGDETKCGIVFTPNVNGYKGCVDIANILQKHFQTEVRWFAGSTLATGFTRKRQSEYTRESQKGFKENQFSLIVATKAFGMGINKPNIHYTFHYGIPMSIEGLYQEAGRAGRDRIKFKKEKAQCLILLSKSDETHLSKLWERETPLSIVKEIQEKDKTSGDINTNLFLFCKDLEVIPKEFSVMKSLYTRFAKPNQNGVKITWKKYKRNELTGKASQQTERAIYKLSQIGIVKDWTINHKDGCFEVDFNDFSEQTILTSLLETIRKYDPEYSLVKLEEDSQHIYQKFLDYLKRNHNKTDATDNALLNPSKTDKYMLRLLSWHDENFIYSRRQSLGDVYKWCCYLADKGEEAKGEFKKHLEDYFRFSETTDSLQVIAETPANYKEWFKVFYQPQSSRLKTKEEQQSLRSSLSRFLETYKENSGLNLISGLLHLLLDDYEDRDGKSRLEGALEKIQEYGPYEKQYIIEEILKIGKESDDKNKALLAKSLHKFFDSGKFLYTLHGVLNDSYSLAILLRQASNRLQKVKENLNDGLKEIR